MRRWLAALVSISSLGGCDDAPTPPDMSRAIHALEQPSGELNLATAPKLLFATRSRAQHLASLEGLLRMVVGTLGDWTGSSKTDATGLELSAEPRAAEETLAVVIQELRSPELRTHEQATTASATSWATLTRRCPGWTGERHGQLELTALLSGGESKREIIWGAAKQCRLGTPDDAYEYAGDLALHVPGFLDGDPRGAVLAWTGRDRPSGGASELVAALSLGEGGGDNLNIQFVQPVDAGHFVVGLALGATADVVVLDRSGPWSCNLTRCRHSDGREVPWGAL